MRGPDPGDAERLLALLARIEGALDRPPVQIATSGVYARALGGESAALRLGEGPSTRAVASCLGDDGEPIALFVAERRDGDDPWRAAPESAAAESVELLRERFGRGLTWVELTEAGEPVEAGAYLWPGHTLALAHGLDLARIGYWAALGARLPLSGSGRRSHRLARVGDPGPAFAAAGQLVRGRRP